MTKIELKNVSVDLPIYGAHNMNLKGKLLSAISMRKSEIETIRALKNVSLNLNIGDRVGIQGPNGAGKTTLLKILAGILEPNQGSVQIEGYVVSMIDQSLGFDMNCTGRENIIRRGIFLRQTRSTMNGRMAQIIEFSELGDRIDHPLYTYSNGMRTRLAFSISTCVEPEILIIDEGIGMADEQFSQKASVALNQFVSKSKILVMASHSKHLLNLFCDSIIEIKNGEIQDTI